MLIVRGRRVILPEGERSASIHIDRETIVAIGAHGEAPAGADVLDAGDLVVSPGIVDTHVHVNEPGRTDWEGFDTATRAAAAGGVTTIVDMPLNSIPATTTVDALERKRAAARGQCHVDVAFWGGVVPGNADELDALVDAGVRGFKCFLVPSGVDEFPAVRARDLQGALPIIARRHVPLLVHAELPSELRPADRTDHTYQTYLSTRPPEAEVGAIRVMVRLAGECDAHVHIVHVSAAESIRQILMANANPNVGAGFITAETCPHYLTFAADEIPDGATEFKCAPPIREACHRAALRDAASRGILIIVTDHSPAPPAMKSHGGFMGAWGGIASLELSLAAVRTALPASPLTDLASSMSGGPAALAGFRDRKGRIAPGYDADLVIWDPDAEFVVDAARLQQRHKLTPYAGRRLTGIVRTTLLRGERIWHDGRLVTPGAGRLL